MTPATTSESRYIIMTNPAFSGETPSVWESPADGGPDHPVTYATQREAWKEAADFLIMSLQAFIEDDTRPDDEEPDLGSSDYVIPCTVFPDGRIEGEGGTIFDPELPSSHYGR